MDLLVEDDDCSYVADFTPSKNGFKAYVPSNDPERIGLGLEEDQFKEH
jgi:hypothetical protein